MMLVIYVNCGFYDLVKNNKFIKIYCLNSFCRFLSYGYDFLVFLETWDWSFVCWFLI